MNYSNGIMIYTLGGKKSRNSFCCTGKSILNQYLQKSWQQFPFFLSKNVKNNKHIMWM